MSLYESALNEYENENDDGKSRLIYAYFGLAIYSSNCLEETLSQMIWFYKIFNSKEKKNINIREIVETVENSKKTLGQLLIEMYQFYNIIKEHKEQLDFVLNTRNYLIHKYFRNHIEKCYSDVGRKDMIKYFCDFKDNCNTIDRNLQIYFEHFKIKLGFTQDKVEQLMKEMIEIEQLKNKAENN